MLHRIILNKLTASIVIMRVYTNKWHASISYIYEQVHLDLISLYNDNKYEINIWQTTNIISTTEKN